MLWVVLSVALVKGAAYGKAEAHASARPEGYAYADVVQGKAIEKAKTGGFDFMFNLTGIIGLAAFAFIIYAIVYLEVPENNKEVWIHLIGICEGIVLSIFGYFYGSAVRKNKQ